MQEPAWTDQWIRTLKLTWAATVLSSPLRKCIPKHLNPFDSLLALIYQILMVESLELCSWYSANIAQHDQCMTSSLFHPVPLSQTCSNFNTKTRILYSIQMLFSSFLIFSYHVSSSFNCFLLSRLPFSISYGSRVFPKAWTHRAQSFGSHQSAAEMGDRNPSDWLHVQPAMEAKYAKWKRGAGFGWGFFWTKKKFQKQSSHHFHIIISKNHQKSHHPRLWHPGAAVLLHNPIEYLRSTFLSDSSYWLSKKLLKKALYMMQHWQKMIQTEYKLIHSVEILWWDSCNFSAIVGLPLRIRWSHRYTSIPRVDEMSTVCHKIRQLKPKHVELRTHITQKGW